MQTYRKSMWETPEKEKNQTNFNTTKQRKQEILQTLENAT